MRRLTAALLDGKLIMSKKHKSHTTSFISIIEIARRKLNELFFVFHIILSKYISLDYF